jgi:cytochrome c nitrite reductase small subunit
VDEDERMNDQDSGETAAAADEGAGTEAATPAGKPPARWRRRWVIALSILGGVIVILIIAAFVTAHFTSASSFCDSCHEMDPYYLSWHASSHNGVECRQCHIPPGAIPYIETKLGSFREIYVHFSSHPDAPLAVTREIPNSNCLACHNPPPDPSLPTVNFKHAGHANLDCISCHIRFVHTTVNPPEYVDPAAMSSCFKCHNGSIAPNNCSYCHTPPHEARGECSTCHDQQSWTGDGPANHPFPRTGAHADLTCKDCHVSKPGVENIAGTSLAKADPACISCHGDKHGGLTDCASCHTPTQWSTVDFKHPFALTGAHAKLSCSDCHVSTPGGKTIPGTNFPAAGGKTCVSCHGKQHGGLTNCASCHTTTAFKPSTFRHPATGGEHTYRSFACVKCHPSGYATHSCTCHGGSPPSGD